MEEKEGKEVTSAEANKVLKNLMLEKEKILTQESLNSTFIAATTEDKESVRPKYNFAETRKLIKEYDDNIRAIKHAINAFNITAEVVPGITIDKALILLPQLQSEKNILDRMRRIPSKVRQATTGQIIDYKYANFDPEEVEKEYQEKVKLINTLQLALDKINTTAKFEI